MALREKEILCFSNDSIKCVDFYVSAVASSVIVVIHIALIIHRLLDFLIRN